MKKKIALFLVAMLLGIGLIVSCGGGDDGEEETQAAAVKYTVAFDANGGELAAGTKIVVSVESGKTIGKGWPDDPVKTTLFDYGPIEDDFNGWFEGTTKYTASTPITKDVTLVASYTPFVKPEREEKYVTALGFFTNNNNLTTQRGWRANGADDVVTTLEWADIAEAKYIVLHTKGGSGTDWESGFGGIQVVIQGDGNGWAWGGSQTNINSFGFTRSATTDVLIVIDLTKINTYNKFVKGGVGKFIIAYYSGKTNALGLGLQEAYLTNKELAAPNGSVLLAGINDNETDKTKTKTIGFAAKVTDKLKTDLGLVTGAPQIPVTVTFDGQGVVDNPDPATVEKGSGIKFQFPDYVKAAGWTFLGWFDGAPPKLKEGEDGWVDKVENLTPDETWGEKYDATTAIAANKTLKAGWLQQKWPPDPTPADITGYTKFKVMADDKTVDGVDYNWGDAGGHSAQAQFGRWGSKGALDKFLTDNKGVTLRFYLNVTVDKSNDGTKPESGVGAVGGWSPSDDNTTVTIPKNAPDGNYKWVLDVPVTDALFATDGGGDATNGKYIIVNLWGGCFMTKIEVWNQN